MFGLRGSLWFSGVAGLRLRGLLLLAASGCIACCAFITLGCGFAYLVGFCGLFAVSVLLCGYWRCGLSFGVFAGCRCGLVVVPAAL